jgi:hypothetical protein
MVNYRIQSKIIRPDGTPDFVKPGKTEDFERTVQFHRWNLKQRTHPDPQMMSYACSRGWDVFDYIIEPEEISLNTLIEQAILKPAKEKRGTKSSG